MTSVIYPAHTLLWVDEIAAFESNTKPKWYLNHKSERPVVVRRALHPRLIPVGIRGANRSERAGAWVDPKCIHRVMTPEQLVQGTPWIEQYTRHPLKQIFVLSSIQQIFSRFNIRWGVGGSVGFELASSMITANDNSDLDLIAYLPKPINDHILRSLYRDLNEISVKMDVQIETLNGAFALREWLQVEESKNSKRVVMMKTPKAPMLVSDPWY